MSGMLLHLFAEIIRNTEIMGAFIVFTLLFHVNIVERIKSDLSEVVLQGRTICIFLVFVVSTAIVSSYNHACCYHQSLYDYMANR